MRCTKIWESNPKNTGNVQKCFVSLLSSLNRSDGFGSTISTKFPFRSRYRMFNLMNKEFTFDVDVSMLECGLNGALYFVEMDADGGAAKHPTNKVFWDIHKKKFTVPIYFSFTSIGSVESVGTPHFFPNWFNSSVFHRISIAQQELVIPNVEIHRLPLFKWHATGFPPHLMKLFNEYCWFFLFCYWNRSSNRR